MNIKTIALNIIADATNEKVLSRLRVLIQDNIQIYETRQVDFNGLDSDKLYSRRAGYLLARALLLKDKEAIKDFPYPTECER